jgi:hypothetical protein
MLGIEGTHIIQSARLSRSIYFVELAPPASSPSSECCRPPPSYRGGTHSLCVVNLDEGTDILVLYTSSTGGKIV